MARLDSAVSPLPLWGKLERTDAETELGWHSLVDHSADVAACMEALLRLPTVQSRLAALAGVDKMPDVWLLRVAAHTFLHDLGKANRGFRRRLRKGAPTIGHVVQAVALLRIEELQRRVLTALPIEQMSDWGAYEEAFLSIVAHHGRPVALDSIVADDHRAVWLAGDDCDPVADLAELGTAGRRWFPLAFVPGGALLPTHPPFWHAIAGLAMLADWIGSDTDIFPFSNGDGADRMAFARRQAAQALCDLGFDPSGERVGINTPTFGSVSPYPPRDIQLATGQVSGQVVVMESETGSGKTEAALYRFARLFAEGQVDGLYFALPTRVAATSLYNRVCDAVERLYADRAKPTVVLAVPGYMRADRVSGRVLPEFAVQWDDDPNDAERRARWAAEHPKRYLAGTIAVGTIDQVLLGAITVRYAHMRAACLMRHLLVVDEVHASDTYMEGLLTHLLSLHTQAGGHALLLSATLGSSARARLFGGPRATPPVLADAELMDYPAISTSTARVPVYKAGSERSKSVAMTLSNCIGDADAIAAMALDAAGQGAKVLIVRNLQREAVATARALFAQAGDHSRVLFRCAGIATVHHGRFAREDRARLDAAVEAAIGRKRADGGLIVIGTQTLEQSLDIDADLIITDLCPADVLLQRLGRLHRHLRDGIEGRESRPAGFETPRAIVLCPLDLGALLTRPSHGLGGRKNPYPNLIVAEATRRLIESQPVWNIPAMNRMLVERTTHPEALETLARELEDGDRRWRGDLLKMTGKAFGDVQAAAHARLRWDASWTHPDVVFPEDEYIATRLGARDLIVKLPGPAGPFGQPIRTLAIPQHWLHGVDVSQDVEPTVVSAADGSIRFNVQTVSYQYDRFGLARI
jgi:CRISPR-associated endonuclease/helicase Cas3